MKSITERDFTIKVEYLSDTQYRVSMGKHHKDWIDRCRGREDMTNAHGFDIHFCKAIARKVYELLADASYREQ